VVQQIGRANVMGPPAHFEQFLAIGEIEAPPTELQVQADDNRGLVISAPIFAARTTQILAGQNLTSQVSPWQGILARQAPLFRRLEYIL